MKKSRQYMSDEKFNLLVESLNQAIEYERGERDDLRVTVLAAPPQKQAKTMKSKTSLRQKLRLEIESLSDADLKQVADYVAFLKFQEQSKVETVKSRAGASAVARG
jgi:hypothetical protein